MSRKLKAGLLIALLAANALLSPVLSCTAYADTDLTADNTGIVHINSLQTPHPPRPGKTGLSKKPMYIVLGIFFFILISLAF